MYVSRFYIVLSSLTRINRHAYVSERGARLLFVNSRASWMCSDSKSQRFSLQNAASSDSNVPERHLRKRMWKTYNVLQGIVPRLAVKYCSRFADHKLSQEPPMSRRSYFRKSIVLIYHTSVTEIIYYYLYATYFSVIKQLY